MGHPYGMLLSPTNYPLPPAPASVTVANGAAYACTLVGPPDHWNSQAAATFSAAPAGYGITATVVAWTFNGTPAWVTHTLAASATTDNSSTEAIVGSTSQTWIAVVHYVNPTGAGPTTSSTTLTQIDPC